MLSALFACALAQADPTTSVAIAPGASQPAVALHVEGLCVVAFFRNGNVEVSLSTDGGKAFAAPVVAMDGRGKASVSNQHGPRVSLDSKKRIYVTAPLALEGTTVDVYAACSADGGKTFSKPVRVNDPPGSLREALHDSAVAPSGELHVAWLDHRAADSPPAIYYSKVTDQARKAGKNVLVAPNASELASPALALDGRGQPFIAFFDGPKKGQAKKNRLPFLASGAAFKIAPLSREDPQHAVCPKEAPAIGVSADGKMLAAAWVDLRQGPDDRNVYWSLGDPAKPAAESAVHEDRRYYQGRPTLAVDAAGTAWCCWEDGREGIQRIFFASSSYKGNFRVGPVTEDRGAYPSVAAAGKRVAVVYENGKGVSFALLSAP